MSAVNPMPDRYPGVSPYLIVEDPEEAIAFYQRAFGAAETMRLTGADGRVMHAELRISGATVMLSGPWPDMGYRTPKQIGGAGVSLCVFVPDVDALAAQAQAAGAEVLQPLETKFYGDRAITLRDPSGHVWAFMTHVEDVPDDEMQERARKAMGG
ncbi:MAG TPA: VOC family protein [Beijerinckiaceae bacterium]